MQRKKRKKERDPFSDPFDRLRKPVPTKPGVTFRSRKDYNRKRKRKIIEDELIRLEEEMYIDNEEEGDPYY